MNRKIEKLALTDASAAQREKDWNAWRDAVDQWPYVSALRLHEDPGRARTHMVLEHSVYTPDAGTMAKDKFRIVGCSVCRMVDVYSQIEAVLGLDSGEGKEYCEGLLKDQSHMGIPVVTFLILRFAEGVTTWLDCGTCGWFGRQDRYSDEG